MSNIVFIKPCTADLPEVSYYTHFLASRFPNTGSSIQSNLNFYLLGNLPNAIWYFVAAPRFYHFFLLLILKFKGVKILFDYRSGSVGKYRFLFDIIKVFYQILIAPDYIIYLNNFVQSTFLGRLFPSTPQGIIDMPSFYPVIDYDRLKLLPKKYRILFYAKNDEQISFYLSLRSRIISIQNHFPDFLILSNCFTSSDIHRLSKIPNLVVSHPLQHDTYMTILSQSRYHLIHYPDVLPYSRQTSTRLLDSLALSVIPICSSTYSTRKFIKSINLLDHVCLYHSYDDISSFLSSPSSSQNFHEFNHLASESTIYDTLSVRQTGIDNSLGDTFTHLLS